MRFRGVLLTAAFPLATIACAPAVRPGDATASALRADPLRKVRLGPAVTGARLVPIDVPNAVGLGVEPGGGARSIPGGVRIVSLPGGGVVSAEDRLPGGRWDARDVVELPERLGGGFLFRIDDKSVWRADAWLGPARPIYAANAVISQITPGLDRVYVLAGAWRAIDGVTGEAKPLGPWPASPTIGGYAAVDGWHALAIADLRGAVVTTDAGATWHTLPLPIEARGVTVRGDSLEVRGPELGRSEAAYDVRPDGQIVRVVESARAPGAGAETSVADPTGPLGGHALAAAVDDGWPLEDGTALVARDGALVRVRLEDGAIVETAPGAFPLRPSRCHPIALGPPGELGFVCGEPRGVTAVYAFDVTRGRLAEVRRFDAPRAVLASGNGAIAVRGPCDAREPEHADAEAHHYCVRTRDGAWREIRVEGAIGGERVAVLGDGRFVIVSPPQGNLDAARVTIVAGENAQSVAVTFPSVPPMSADLRRVLDVGVWLDGIEERRPGVLGGWIEAGGTMLGYELALDGRVALGALVRGDTALPMVSGRFGLGWSGSHSGLETTDGGMTWASIVVPDPIQPLREIGSRACGPVGCSAAGWLRIGWGGAGPAQTQAPHFSAPALPRTYLSLPLECDPLEQPRRAAGTDDSFGPAPAGVSPTDMRVVRYDTSDTLDHAPRITTLGRVYVWGPKSVDWDHGAKWLVRWDWPFGGASEARSSAPAAAPSVALDASRSTIGVGPALQWSIAVGDDASHALLVTGRSHSEATVFELEADRTPVEIRRADGEPFAGLDAAARIGGRWYLATPPPLPQGRVQGGRMESIVWQVDGAVARELARIPRTPGQDGRVGSARLAWQADGRALGFVVDGQALAERPGATRWVAPIDLDSGAMGSIEPLGSFELGDRASISLCTANDAGWTTDVALAFPIPVVSRETSLGGLHSAFGRVRLGSTRACVERISGSPGATIDPVSHHAAAPTPPLPAGASITVAVSEGKERRVFRCGVR